MKTALFAVLWALAIVLALADRARASGAITIEIKSTDTGLTYVVHKQGYHLDMATMTPDEIEGWLRSVLPKIPKNDLILIYTDPRVPFQSVLDMMRRFRAAGVERFAVCSGEGSDMQPALIGTFDSMRLQPPSPPRPSQ